MKTSTKDIFARHGWRLDKAAHNWIYFVFYRPYVRCALAFAGLAERRLSWFSPVGRVARAVFDRYHSKVLTPTEVDAILSLDRDLFLGKDEHKRVIPFKYANRILFREPTMIAVMDCPCKLARKAPCRPVNACIAVGRDFALLWLEHCKHNNARRISQDEARELIATLRASGHVQQAFLKVATGGITGVICNCCPECCVSLEATRIARGFDPALSMNASSGYSVDRDESLCTGCGTCVSICPFKAMTDGSPPAYDRAGCLGCGLCVDNCPSGALSLYVDKEKPAPLDIHALANTSV